MSKSRSVSAALARRLLAVAVGEQIPTTAELAEELGAGFGTVHSALKALQAEGAVELSTHGHQGTRLVDRDLVALWRASDRGSLMGVLPLPQSIEFTGLATAVSALADKAGLPLQLTFHQGASKRFELLREERVDWVLTSGFAAASEAAWCDAVMLPEHTYYSQDSVVVITPAGGSPEPDGRVAIDRRSHDHVTLTLAEFPDADLVDAAYWWIPEILVRGEVDAAVWHQTSSSSLLTATGLAVHPLRRPGPSVDPAFNRAALVFRSDDLAVRALLAALFPPSDVADLQEDVTSRRLPPAF